MLKNNLVALFTHVIFSLIIERVAKIPGVYELAAFLTSFVFLICYILLGRKLKNQNSHWENFLSVFSIAAIGIIWDLANNLKVFCLPSEWLLHYYYPLLLLMYVPIFKVIPSSIFLIPTILMWIGIEWKWKTVKKDINKTQSIG